MFCKWDKICFGLIIQLVAGEVGEECFVSGDVLGICLNVTQCDIALRSIMDSGSPRLPRCGFDGKTEIICCPKKKANPRTRRRVADRECEKISASYDPPSSTKIISGVEASEGEFPHMVAIFFTGDDSKYYLGCGGSLISDRYILTAAHCAQIKVGWLKPVFVRVGVIDISEATFNSSTDYNVDRTIIHPNYKRPSVYHDLAIIRLKEPVVMSDLIFPACLYTKNEDPAIQLDITGWGISKVGRSDTSIMLLKGRLSLVTNAICQQSYKVSRQFPQSISSTQLCAYDFNERVDACQGDSGGPLQGLTEKDGYYRLIGVTSHGMGCASSAPGVYTKVNEYLDWIESVVWSSDRPLLTANGTSELDI